MEPEIFDNNKDRAPLHVWLPRTRFNELVRLMMEAELAHAPR